MNTDNTALIRTTSEGLRRGGFNNYQNVCDSRHKVVIIVAMIGFIIVAIIAE